jgi:maltose O-acetyltransferase
MLMNSYHFRLFARFVASELIPVSFRARLMQLIGFTLPKTALVWPGANFRSTKVMIGEGAFINVGFYHDGCGDLYIGNNVSIGPYVRIITGTHETGPSRRRCSTDVSKPVRIEDGCWIGAGVTILPGVTVESGCVVAAGAVVVASTEADGLYSGVPARRARDLSS